jgi:hypothetical protein
MEGEVLVLQTFTKISNVVCDKYKKRLREPQHARKWIR